ncbi:MAG: tryptophan--tRNA ligase [Archaeoglobi archaeon]|nr:tryptophan--tRNA ligase [Candidatus Mnemosynella bozhongmuii]
MRINPWEAAEIEDYSRLFEDFGISPFSEILREVPEPHRLMRRGVIFGHRDYQRILDAMKRKESFAVMSGFMPSGKVHLGGKMVMEEIIWHQQRGAHAHVAIADMEAHSVRGLSWEKCVEIGIEEYVLSLIALGFKPENSIIYFQSAFGKVKDLAFELGNEVTLSEMSAIYGFSGESHISHLFSVLVQAADILHPQLSEFGGPKPVVVPVGADQDPHLRLTRDLADRMNLFLIERRGDYISIRGKGVSPERIRELSELIPFDKKVYEAHIDVFGGDEREIRKIVEEFELSIGGYSFIPPSSTYHRFMSGLRGGKMSSSKPESFIALTDSPEDAKKKVMRAKTGGQGSVEKQRELGGSPENCVVFELFTYHLIEDDEELMRIHSECTSGERLCGECKKLASELLAIFLKEHREMREQARDLLKEYEVIGWKR